MDFPKQSVADTVLSYVHGKIGDEIRDWFFFLYIGDSFHKIIYFFYDLIIFCCLYKKYCYCYIIIFLEINVTWMLQSEQTPVKISNGICT